MESLFLRDYAMYAAIFGFFAMSWYGWAQENPPKSWKMWLILGSLIGLIVTIAGLIIAIQHWNDGSVLSAPGAMQYYRIVVGVEFAIAGLGVGVLYWRKWQRYNPPWIVFVVGIHFIALATTFKDSWLYVLSALLVAIAIFSLWIGGKKTVAVSAICGILSGTVLLLFALRGLIGALVLL